MNPISFVPFAGLRYAVPTGGKDPLAYPNQAAGQDVVQTKPFVGGMASQVLFKRSSGVRFGGDQTLALASGPALQVTAGLYDQMTQLRSAQGRVTLASLFARLLTSPEVKPSLRMDTERALMDVLKIAPQTFLSLVNAQQAPTLDEDAGEGFSRQLEGLFRGFIGGGIDTSTDPFAAPGGNEQPTPTALGVAELVAEIKSQMLAPGEGIPETLAEMLQAKSYLRLKDGKEVSSVLDEYAQDMTLASEAGRHGPLIGREKEALRVLNTLTKYKKRTPVLVGEAGVGKTAVMESVAAKLVSGDVLPELMREDGRGMFLKHLDWAQIDASPEKPQIWAAILKEMKERADELIVFYDEFHTVRPSEFSADRTAEAIKEPLARGEIRLVGATTEDEYDKTIAKDGALDRRCTKVLIEEPSPALALTMLRGVREHLQSKHGGILIRDDALEEAVAKAKRYLSMRRLPDSAMDVIDEACARVKNQVSRETFEKILNDGEIQTHKVDLAGIQQRVSQLSADLEQSRLLEEEAKADFDSQIARALPGLAPQERQQAIRSMMEQMLNPESDFAPLNTQAQRIVNLCNTADDLDNARKQLFSRIKAARMNRMDLSEAEKQKEETQGKIQALEAQYFEDGVLPQVTIDVVRQVISDMSRTDIRDISMDEQEKMREIKPALRKRLVGQGHAVEAVASAIRLNKLGLSEGKQPQGAFLFLGPTGTGKTELAKALAEFLFGDEEAMIRLDMSEYMESFAVSRAVGSPPGYVGYEEGGELTNAVRKKPFSVVLLDEFDKAHPDFYNILLQILEDGRLTDGQGRTTDFSNVVLIMTSNRGAKSVMQLFQAMPEGIRSESRRYKQACRDARRLFLRALKGGANPIRPELLNRLGAEDNSQDASGVIVFNPLTRDEISQIITLQIGQLNKVLSKHRSKLQVELAESGREWLIERGTNLEYGARPLKRLVQKFIRNAIANDLVENKVKPLTTILLTREQLEQWEQDALSRTAE